MRFPKLLCFVLCASFALADEECSLLCASGTCCKGLNGRQLCCPAPGGVCCKSGKSCCPPGTICESDGMCTRINSGFFGFFNYAAPPQAQITTEAPHEISTDKLKVNLNTCVKVCGDLCCPFESGICCEDGEHCCPAGYVCDASTKSCRLSSSNPILSSPKGSHNCPLHDSGCSDKETCCVMTDGLKGCCPYPNADCCADGEHCCPEGTLCNKDSTGCVPKRGAWVNPFEPSSKLRDRKSVVCPGAKMACNKGSTCCKTLGDNTTYACCPFENAVCCADGEHCCPQGHSCDPKNGGSCVRLSTESLNSAESSKKSLGGKGCNDGRTVCPDDSTCCELKDGSFGCCPLPNAVCCEDKEHCCPEGYKCDTANQTCVQNANSSIVVPFSKKLKPSAVSSNEETSKCQSGWKPCEAGCCPIKDAVCCSDGFHCCQKGSVCLNNGFCLIDTKDNGPRTYVRAPRLL
ncbi:hypothetical protein Aperf_G00000105424 [Anoplocephala perfoliata]